MRRRAGAPGFTLVETLVVVLITGIVAGGLYQMFYAGRRSHDVQKNLIEMQQNARVAISSLADDFRHVSYGKDPTQPSIRYAGPDSIVFIADLMPEVGGAEVISYYLDGDGDPDTPNPNDTILMKAVADSGGNVLFAQPQSYGIQTGGLAMRYFNGGGTELENPVPQPELIGEMLVEVTATEAASRTGEYATMPLAATVYPRNLPLSPARSRPSTPGLVSLTHPNCSAATMQWTTPTTNTDGSDLPLSEISHFNFYIGTALDDMSLNARLARTFNEWTVSGLGCSTYYLQVTCVSRSGVESYPCTSQFTVSGGSLPKAPAGLFAADSVGVRLTWPPVTQFVDDTPITAQVEYLVYRDTTTPFTPSEGNCIAEVGTATQYHDEASNNCATYYYLVTARVCCEEGAPSPEASADRPSPPQCPTNLVASNGPEPASIDVSWTHPVVREDLSPLDASDIVATYVYYDTLAGSDANVAVFSGEATSGTLTGLNACRDYYVHARTQDACGHMSSSECLVNETAFHLGSPCDDTPPAAPTDLQLVAQDDRLLLKWPANTTDCDFEGYELLYGPVSGVYNGTGAVEGNSPIWIDSGIAQNGVCEFALTGLAECTTYYVAVRCADSCDPPNVSEPSPERNGVTSCTPCQIQASCPTWVATPNATYRDLHLEVYSTSGTDLTLDRLSPVFEGGANILSVYYGRPLEKIWSADGSAGEDGPVGPRPSGSVLEVDDVTVPGWTDEEDGEPLALLFDADMRDVPVTMRFKGPSGAYCTSDGTGRAASVFDDFDDGNIDGWTVRSGTWTSNNGELLQSSTTNMRTLIGNSVVADITWEGKVKIVTGTQAYLVFRYGDDNNMYMAGIRSDTNYVRLLRLRSGTLTETKSVYAPISNNTWYDLKVVVAAKTVRVWLDCVEILQLTDMNMRDTGKIGFRTSSTAARWDDMRCMTSALLP
ncbi:MAG: family 16 glycoside hydrolase [Candidatus Eisenbacteria bacterium]|nr:DUF1080 domain-containing protein [Candidatus Eisenbacteria bacterium]